MMLKDIHLEIISPEEILCKQDVSQVVVPSEEGELGVLYGHEAMIVSLRPGRVKLFSGEEKIKEFIISSGSAEITGEFCVLLIDQAIDCLNMDKRSLQEKLLLAEKELSEVVNDSIFSRQVIENRIAFLRECTKWEEV